MIRIEIDIDNDKANIINEDSNDIITNYLNDAYNMNTKKQVKGMKQVSTCEIIDFIRYLHKQRLKEFLVSRGLGLEKEYIRGTYGKEKL